MDGIYYFIETSNGQHAENNDQVIYILKGEKRDVLVFFMCTSFSELKKDELR